MYEFEPKRTYYFDREQKPVHTCAAEVVSNVCMKCGKDLSEPRAQSAFEKGWSRIDWNK